MSRINLTIDSVVLRGFDPAERHALLDGLKRELSRILADPETRMTLSGSRRTPVLCIGTIGWQPGRLGAGRLGGGIARAIGKGIKP